MADHLFLSFRDIVGFIQTFGISELQDFLFAWSLFDSSLQHTFSPNWVHFGLWGPCRSWISLWSSSYFCVTASLIAVAPFNVSSKALWCCFFLRFEVFAAVIFDPCHRAKRFKDLLISSLSTPHFTKCCSYCHKRQIWIILSFGNTIFSSKRTNNEWLLCADASWNLQNCLIVHWFSLGVTVLTIRDKRWISQLDSFPPSAP